MYELSRVRLFSIGPAGARYSDVTLDLSEVGAPVRAPRQESLFGLTDNATVRRPSPATVLFLENGGGKSVLMKLIFSVMLPGRRQVVGTTSTRVLEKFVRAGDVAHVLLEWQHTQTGARVITGKVSEWRGHVVSSDPAKLADSWYSFRPSPALRLDTVPVTDNGRLVTMSGFAERLKEAHRADPSLQVVWTSGHGDWTAHLTGLGLDPELFRYQRAMNAGEGEAAEAFTFRSDDAFVDFLLRAVIEESDPNGLAEVVAGYADTLAQRSSLSAERHFVAGALERLTPLAENAAAATAASERADEARGRARRFAAAITQRHEADLAVLGVGETRLGDLTAEEQNAERQHARLRGVAQELQRLVAGMRLRRAEAEKQELEAKLDETRIVVESWRETETVLRSIDAGHRADALRKLVAEKEEGARPALEARDVAAHALARGLLATAAHADAAAAQSAHRAAALREQENTVTTERDELVRVAADASARSRAFDDRVAEARHAITEHVRSGLLPSDTADVAEHSRLATEAAAQATIHFNEALADRDRLTAQLTAAADTAHTARRTADTCTTTLATATETHRVATGRGAALAAQERLAELLGADQVWLDNDLPALLELLSAAVAAAEQQQTDLKVADAEDLRALAALGDGGLLPPPADVTATVAALTDAGITAWPGWRYVSQLPAADREAVLRRSPHLVDGVVLNDPVQLERAERILTDARLLPRSVVAVGATESLTVGSTSTLADMAFLVPPNPAMYDEEQAEAERVAIDRRHHDRAGQLRELSTQLAADRKLAEQLSQFREDYPEGTLDRLRADHDDAERALTVATAALTTAETIVADSRAAEEQSRTRIADLNAEAQRLHDRANKLAELAGRVANIGQWTVDAAAATDAARSAKDEAAEAMARAETLRGRAEAAVRESDDHTRTAHGCRQELREVTGGGAVSEDDPPPDQPLDVLRGVARAAADAYAKVAVGSDLRAELDQADTTAAHTRAKLAELRPEVRDKATVLISTPDGADPAARAAAAQRAERDMRALDEEVKRASGQVGSLLTSYQNLPVRDRSLEPYGKPEDIEHGETLIAQAADDLQAAEERHVQLSASRVEVEETVLRARDAVIGFRSILDSLHGIEPEEPAADAEPVEPFGGDVEFARHRRDDIRTGLDSASRLLATAEQQVRAASDELAEYASEAQFEQVTSPVRRQVVKVKRDELATYATEWERALHPRLRSLDDKLAQIGRHRAAIVERLTGMVESALRTLRSAQKLSMLPDGLGDWSGQEFLRIKFGEIEPALLAERLGEVIDDAAAAESAAAKRDGMSLLLRGVHAATPKGFRVEMLKPDAVLRTERLRVSEIRDVFSGGQQLTAAIILYCTMAALRANDRGQARQRHSGVLFLDNPIGRASAGYLLELQLAVSEALGVQLVYTTGLFDSSALSVFPLIVRLRNDADLRAGLKYLSVDATIRKELDTLGEPDDTARITATRAFTRPPEPAPVG